MLFFLHDEHQEELNQEGKKKKSSNTKSNLVLCIQKLLLQICVSFFSPGIAGALFQHQVQITGSRIQIEISLFPTIHCVV